MPSRPSPPGASSPPPLARPPYPVGGRGGPACRGQSSPASERGPVSAEIMRVRFNRPAPAPREALHSGCDRRGRLASHSAPVSDPTPSLVSRVRNVPGGGQTAYRPGSDEVSPSARQVMGTVFRRGTSEYPLPSHGGGRVKQTGRDRPGPWVPLVIEGFELGQRPSGLGPTGLAWRTGHEHLDRAPDSLAVCVAKVLRRP